MAEIRVSFAEFNTTDHAVCVHWCEFDTRADSVRVHWCEFDTDAGTTTVEIEGTTGRHGKGHRKPNAHGTYANEGQLELRRLRIIQDDEEIIMALVAFTIGAR